MTREMARTLLEHEQALADPLNPDREPPTEEEIDRYVESEQ